VGTPARELVPLELSLPLARQLLDAIIPLQRVYLPERFL